MSSNIKMIIKPVIILILQKMHLNPGYKDADIIKGKLPPTRYDSD